MTCTFFRRTAGLLALLTLLAASSAYAAIPASQRQFLQDLYASTQDIGWKLAFNWNGVPGSECGWQGITCDPAQTTVQEIYLPDNNLRNAPGTLLPDWSALPDLKRLSLAGNQLSGPAHAVAGLAKLEVFDISYNQFSGTMPDPSGLQHLLLYGTAHNQFTGHIAPLLNLPAITSFWVSYNRLTGPAPAAPSSLAASDSGLCPNYLTPSASNDWNAATGETPWHANCTAAPPDLGGVAAVPTLGEWALAALILATAALALGGLRQRCPGIRRVRASRLLGAGSARGRSDA